MIIDFQIIAHKKQRYDTVGDYYWKKGGLFFRVSKMRYMKYSMLVFLHEIIEFFLCAMAGIKMRDIDKFDMEYEKARETMLPTAPCGHLFFEEPGDDPHAPYHHQHICASRCERLIAQCAGVDWEQYCEEVRRLSQGRPKTNRKAA